VTVALIHVDDGRLNGFAYAHDIGFRVFLSELVVSLAAQGLYRSRGWTPPPMVLFRKRLADGVAKRQGGRGGERRNATGRDGRGRRER
jgi:hypothetical protein